MPTFVNVHVCVCIKCKNISLQESYFNQRFQLYLPVSIKVTSGCVQNKKQKIIKLCYTILL